MATVTVFQAVPIQGSGARQRLGAASRVDSPDVGAHYGKPLPHGSKDP